MKIEKRMISHIRAAKAVISLHPQIDDGSIVIKAKIPGEEAIDLIKCPDFPSAADELKNLLLSIYGR